MEEYKNVEEVLKHIKKNVIFADAMDELANFPKAMSCADISARLFDNLHYGNVGIPLLHFSADLSLSLMNYMTNHFIDPLMQVQPFLRSILVREEVQKVFKSLL